MKLFESSELIGRIDGFPVSVERFDDRATLLIHGKQSYPANVSDSPAGTIASLEHTLDSFEDRLREREADLAQSRQQSADLTKQLDQPFEHGERLDSATKRQQEIIAARDITKNQPAMTIGDAIAVDGATSEVAATTSKNLPAEILNGFSILAVPPVVFATRPVDLTASRFEDHVASSLSLTLALRVMVG